MATHPLIACTRMYNATEAVVSTWQSFVQEVATRSGTPLTFERWPYPLDIEELWKRPDLGLTFICGRVFILYGQKHVPIAVPVRAESGMPVYNSKLLVRADSTFARLEDTFGSRLGWTVTHSHSGFLAVKKLLAPYQAKSASPLYENVGPLHTPANCLKALAQDAADIVPLDGWYYELLQRHAPEKLAGTRILIETDNYPMPFLAASPGTDPAVCERLAAAVQEVAALPAMRPALELLGLTGFARPNPTDYAVMGDL